MTWKYVMASMNQKPKCKYCLNTGWVPSDIGGPNVMAAGLVAEVPCPHCEKGQKAARPDLSKSGRK